MRDLRGKQCSKHFINIIECDVVLGTEILECQNLIKIHSSSDKGHGDSRTDSYRKLRARTSVPRILSALLYYLYFFFIPTGFQLLPLET